MRPRHLTPSVSVLLALAAASCLARSPTTEADHTGAPGSRLIVRTAEYRLEVERLQGVEATLRHRVEELGGFVVRAESSGAGEAELLIVTFRVPAAKFDEAATELETLASRVESRRLTGEDVTEEYVDLGAQRDALEATRTRLNGLLEKAENVEGTLAVSRALTETQTALERLEGRQRFLRESAALSSFSVTFSTAPGGLAFRPLDVASGAVAVLRVVLAALANTVIVVAVFSVLWAPPLFAWRRWRKRQLTTAR